MTWIAVFVICWPDALRGDQCPEVQIGGWPTETACHVDRPFARQMLILQLQAAGYGAVSVDDGVCVPPGEPA